MTRSEHPAGLPRNWLSLVLMLVVLVGGSQSWAWWREQQSARLIKQLALPDSITLFTTSTCPYCAQARQWLKQHEVPWLECNIDTNQTCLRKFESQGSPGVPLVLANGQWQTGFDVAWLAQALQNTPPAVQVKPNAETSPRP